MIVRVLIAICCSILLSSYAFPHGPAQWIADEHAKGIDGSLCCGEQDCGWISQRDVTATDQGYHIHGLVHVVPPSGQAFTYYVEEVVPYSEAQPSPTGDYWRCSWPTQADRKCMFAPPPGS